MKETYEAMKTCLEDINYSKHNWKIRADVKVISLLVGLQLGYTNIKQMCFCVCGIAGMTQTTSENKLGNHVKIRQLEDLT